MALGNALSSIWGRLTFSPKKSIRDNEHLRATEEARPTTSDNASIPKPRGLTRRKSIPCTWPDDIDELQAEDVDMRDADASPTRHAEPSRKGVELTPSESENEGRTWLPSRTALNTRTAPSARSRSWRNRVPWGSSFLKISTLGNVKHDRIEELEGKVMKELEEACAEKARSTSMSQRSYGTPGRPKHRRRPKSKISGKRVGASRGPMPAKRPSQSYAGQVRSNDSDRRAEEALRRREMTQQPTPPLEDDIRPEKPSSEEPQTGTNEEDDEDISTVHDTPSRTMVIDLFATPDLDPTKKALDLSASARNRYTSEIQALAELARQKAEAKRKAQEEKRRRERELRLAKTGGLREPLKAFIEPVTADWHRKAQSTLQAPRDTVLAKTVEGTDLRSHDFRSVVNISQWLNDEIINGTLTWLEQSINLAAGITDPKKQTRKCLALGSFFWKHLQNKGGKETQRMLRRKGVEKSNFLNIETIFWPICENMHWTLMVVRPKNRTIAYVDSMRVGAPAITFRKRTDLVLAWIKDILGDTFIEAPGGAYSQDDRHGNPADGWRVVRYDSPEQRNGYDCGVFTITNAMCLSLGLNPADAYLEEELPEQRMRIACVLLNGGFTGDFDLSAF